MLDPSTGLHVTAEAVLVDLDSYRLRVAGAVQRPLELTYDEIRCLPKLEAAPALECPGFFVDYAKWGGTPIREVLGLAGTMPEAETVIFTCADSYSVTMPLEDAYREDFLLAYEWDGEPLPRLHGFPLRLVLPGREGSTWAKWITEIRVD
jgi:DMSO/TMAO reductase YedYZ molybdopterin-dependent catalytic subunit